MRTLTHLQKWFCGLLVGMLGLGCPVATHGQLPGSIDAGWGTAGWVRLNLEQDEHCTRILPALDGGAFLFGRLLRYDSIPDMDYFVAKTLPDGQLDPNFGQLGVVRGDFGGRRHSRIVDADLAGEYIYIIGEAQDNGTLDSQEVYIGKLNVNGNWETSFGYNGLQQRDYLGGYSAAGGIEVLGDGRIFYCGATSDTSTWHTELPMAGRLLPSGVADSSFGGTGALCWGSSMGLQSTRRVHNEGGKFNCLLPLGNGSYLLGGYFFAGNYTKPMFMALDATGLLADGFGQNGVLFPEVNPNLSSAAVKMSRSGALVVVAMQSQAYPTGGYMALLTMDSTGGQLQYEPIDFDQHHTQAQAMCVDDERRIIVAGYGRQETHDSPGWESDGFAVMARSDISNWVINWENGGQSLHMHSPGMESGATAMAYLPDDSYLLAGYVNDSSANNPTDLLLLRLHGGAATNTQPDAMAPALCAYPNPVLSGGMLHFSKAIKGKIELTDTWGRKWMLEKSSDGKECQLPYLPTGTYVLQADAARIRLLVR